MQYLKERQWLCQIARNLFERKLTDAAGGNLSVKVTDHQFLMTPTLASSRRLWLLEPEDILLVDKNLSILEGKGNTTRESNMHLAFYKADERIKAVIHSHPRNLMVYAAMGIEMPIVCENLRFAPSLQCLRYVPATTIMLADEVYCYATKYRKKYTSFPYGMLLREHGIILGAESLATANDFLERLETNAFVHLQSQVLIKNGYRYYTDQENVTYERNE